MKNFLLFLIFLVFVALPAFAQVAKTQVNAVTNLIVNGDFSAGVNARHTHTGPNAATATINGIGAAWTPTAGGQYYQTAFYQVPTNLQGASCAGKINYKTSEATNPYSLVVVDNGGNVLGSVTLPAVGAFTDYFVPFTCPPSTATYQQIALRELAAPTVPTGSLFWDDEHLGTNINKGNVSQAKVYATAEMLGGANCTFAETTSTTEGSWVSLGSAGSCAQPWTIAGPGNATLASTSSAITLPSLPPGDYKVTLAGYFQVSGATAGAICDFQLTDGTTAFGTLSVYSQASQNSVGGPLIGKISYAAPGSRTFTIQAAASQSSTQCVLNPSVSGRKMQWTIEQFPNAQDQIYSASTSGWRVDALWPGAALTTASVPTYSDMPVSGSLTQQPGSVAVGAACPSGTASAVGNLSCSGTTVDGLTFFLPQAGTAKVCAQFIDSVDTAGLSDNQKNFEIVETAANSSTPIQTSANIVAHRFTLYGINSQNNNTNQYSLCSPFTWASGGQKTLRLQFQNLLNSGTEAASGIGVTRWTVEPISQTAPAPVFVGPYAQMPATQTGAYTAAPGDEIVQVDTSSSVVSITLPNPSVAGRGKKISIARTNQGTNLASITGSISGAPYTTYLHKKEEDKFFSDGSTWQWDSPNDRVEGLYAAECASGTTCPISAQTGNWISSISRSASGVYVANTTFPLLGTLTCSCSSYFSNSANADTFCRAFGSLNSVSIYTLRPSTNTGALVDTGFFITCRADR